MGGGGRSRWPDAGTVPRDARLKAALRANLRRRKARPAEEQATPGPAAGDPGQPDAREAGRPGESGQGENGGT
ncbi:hypothetical protein DLJ49_01685 [Rhodovulum sp. 12E13]|nr:hypothetical protein DLJ49_01685 [Rhodovulum sp. 12E13]